MGDRNATGDSAPLTRSIPMEISQRVIAGWNHRHGGTGKIGDRSPRTRRRAPVRTAGTKTVTATTGDDRWIHFYLCLRWMPAKEAPIPHRTHVSFRKPARKKNVSLDWKPTPISNQGNNFFPSHLLNVETVLMIGKLLRPSAENAETEFLFIRITNLRNMNRIT